MYGYHECRCLAEQKHWIPLDLELQAGASCPKWYQIGSSERAVCALNLCAFSSAPKVQFKSKLKTYSDAISLHLPWVPWTFISPYLVCVLESIVCCVTQIFFSVVAVSCNRDWRTCLTVLGHIIGYQTALCRRNVWRLVSTTSPTPSITKINSASIVPACLFVHLDRVS